MQQGLAKLRQPWIDARGDTEELTVRSSDYTKARLADDGLDELRFSGVLTPKRAKAGRRVTQLHYARQGIITPEMEFIAIRENMGRERIRSEVLRHQHPGMSFGAHLPEISLRNLSVMKLLPDVRLSRPTLIIRNRSR